VQHTVDTYRSPDQPDTAGFCPGPCNSVFRAAERRREQSGAEHDLEPRDGQPVWCPACTTGIRAAVAEWPRLAALLIEEIESGTSAGMSEYVSGSKSKPVHDHEAASFLLDEFAAWISAWEATIRVELRLVRRKATADPRVAIRNACQLLLQHLDWHLRGRADHQYSDITGRQIAEEFGLDLLRYHRRAQHLTSMQDVEPVRVIGVPCPMCDHKSLEREVEGEAAKPRRVARFQYGDDGEVLVDRHDAEDDDARPEKLTETVLAPMQGAVLGYIRCRKCKPTFRMSPDEYETWTKMLAAHEQTRALATREKLAEIFGNSVPTQYKAVR
jgi:hypothetical protein